MYRRHDGYTLIELMVGLNIAFIALTAVFAVYLIGSNMTSFIQEKIGKREQIARFILYTDHTLRRTEGFTIMFRDDTVKFQTDQHTILSILHDGIILEDFINLNTPDGYRLELTKRTGERIAFDREEYRMMYLYLATEGDIDSKEIERIDLTLPHNGDEYRYTYVRPGVAAWMFGNLGE